MLDRITPGGGRRTRRRRARPRRASTWRRPIGRCSDRQSSTREIAHAPRQEMECGHADQDGSRGRAAGCGRRRARRSRSPPAAAAAARSTTQTEANESQAAEAAATAASSTWPSTRGSATRPDAYVVGTVAEQRARLHGQLQGPQGGRLLAGLRHRRGRRRHRGLGPPGPGEEVLRRGRVTAARRTSARTGNVGIIGWYVPPWLAEEHPDILDWKNLNKYADEFTTSESGGKGQFLGADPSYVPVRRGDRQATSTSTSRWSSPAARPPASRRSARPRRTRSALIGYFYEPQWFFAEVPAGAGRRCRRTGGLPGRPGQGRLRLPGDRR